MGAHEGHILLAKIANKITPASDHIKGDEILRKATDFLLRSVELCIQNGGVNFEP
jgi:hypothetical protein